MVERVPGQRRRIRSRAAEPVPGPRAGGRSDSERTPRRDHRPERVDRALCRQRAPRPVAGRSLERPQVSVARPDAGATTRAAHGGVPAPSWYTGERTELLSRDARRRATMDWARLLPDLRASHRGDGTIDDRLVVSWPAGARDGLLAPVPRPVVPLRDQPDLESGERVARDAVA